LVNFSLEGWLAPAVFNHQSPIANVMGPACGRFFINSKTAM
jgi:hypothetical protein